MNKVSYCAVCVLLSVMPTVCAQSTVRHDFVVAAHPSLQVSPQEVDGILSEMGRLMAAKSYDWDVTCPAVAFRRSGNVVTDGRLLSTGTWDQLRDNLKHMAPSANVLIVSNIDCRGAKALGCGVIGQEPLIVGQWEGLNPLIWLHERGHNVGLPHSAEAPADDNTTAHNISWRFMFWQLDTEHLGKNACECAQFQQRKFSSITLASSGASSLPAACVPQEASASDKTFFPIAQNSPDSRLALEQTPTDRDGNGVSKSGLTDAAAKVVNRPWLDGAPVSQIKQLSNIDLDSIRGLLQGNPTQGWPQAVQTLGLVGNEGDVSIIHRALEFPFPKEGGQGAISQNRILIQTKMAVPQALGVLANRTRSDSAVEVLANTADLENATKLVGEGTLAVSLSKSAIQGLTIADDPSGNLFVNATVKTNLPTDGWKNGVMLNNASKAKVAPFNPSEIEALVRSQQKIRSIGVDAVFK
jgi:hypothetical protein